MQYTKTTTKIPKFYVRLLQSIYKLISIVVAMLYLHMKRHENEGKKEERREREGEGSKRERERNAARKTVKNGSNSLSALKMAEINA